MSQVEKHLEWCLRDAKRLVIVTPNIALAEKHLAKSEYNYRVLLTLEESAIYDWALNVGFYAIYHCFLAILAKYGYQSRNQSCTVTALLRLIDERKLDFEKDLVLRFDVLAIEGEVENATVRRDREVSTYGIETSIDLKRLEEIKQLIIQVQRETIRVLRT